jgi:chitin disaccharide deacetylase
MISASRNSSVLQQESLGMPSPGNHAAPGALIINADDWGRDVHTTNCIFDCIRCGSVSSTSAMVFMPDSARAAAIALAESIDAGLHLNLTTPFAASSLPAVLQRHHERVVRFLTSNRLARLFYHPGLTQSFHYVVAAQLEEFCRLYGSGPRRVDGHHHMHLAANVLLSNLLPGGTIARRNFSFQAGEKSLANRAFRKATDAILAKRHRLPDYFFALVPLEPAERLEHIVELSKNTVVEVETHPSNAAEYRFLTESGIRDLVKGVPIASRYQLAV